VMWHAEREDVLDEADVDATAELFGGS
jgi:hypothetical protein